MSSAPAVVSVGQLLESACYLEPADAARLTEAFRFADEAHLGQSRQSGEPYITHPLAVAEVCCSWRLDAEALMAALLHDTVEDCGVSLQEVAERFGPVVSSLVAGLTKLDRIQFQNREEAQAENFRKMFMAMADDVRVILIKLADRLHNMRTMDAVSAPKRARVSRETLELFAPIAHRLGLHEVFREFEDLCFAGLHPSRHQVLQRALLAARGNRKEVVTRLENAVREHLPRFGVEADVTGREKSLYSIYLKMREKRLSFAEVLDIYGFRILVDTPSDCYLALGALHALYRPSPGRFKDYIALPKSNGYQSLHTVVIGPYGTPIEFQIRTHEMHRVAEAGVAAHWLYKEHASNVTPLQQKAHEWMQSLLQSRSGDAGNLIDHVKIDLFPDVIYVFTPNGDIRELPRGSTPVDYAYMVHTDVGNRCIGAWVNNLSKPLDTELRNGDVVRIDTGEEAAPHPGWLSFVKTAKARAEIRHNLKNTTRERSIAFGRRMLEDALSALGVQGLNEPSLQWAQLINEAAAKDEEGILESIGLGHLLANVAARRLMPVELSPTRRQLTPFAERALALAIEHLTQPELGITLNGSEGTAVQYASCCYPIAGDNAWGHMRGGAGLLVHRASCPTARRQRNKDRARWADVIWGDPLFREFETRLDVDVNNSPGALAKVASAISARQANIIDLSIEPRAGGLATLHVAIEVKNRIHLADVLRSVRRSAAVTKATRRTRDSH